MKYTHTHTHTHACAHMHFNLCNGNPRSYDSQEASNTPNIQILILKLPFLLKGNKSPWRNGEITDLDSILKRRDMTLPTKVRMVKTMVFPVVIYGCESWTIKKAEHRRIDAFELWCWRRLFRGPWTASRSNQSILKEISPEYSLEGLMLKLKLQYFGHHMWRTDSLEKTLILGMTEGRRRRWRWRMRWTDGIINTMDRSLRKL